MSRPVTAQAAAVNFLSTNWAESSTNRARGRDFAETHGSLRGDFEALFELPEDLAPALRPFLPHFHHALLDLTRFDPAEEEADTRLRVVLQLMKLARQKELLRFFQWLSCFSARELPDTLLGLMIGRRKRPCAGRGVH